MAGQLAPSELKHTSRPRAEFASAAPEHDADILRLLRYNPMDGRMSLSLERAPSYFLEEAHSAEQRRALVAFDHGQLVCVGSCSVRSRFLAGRAQPIGYLGGLRLDAKAAGRFDILRRGYRFF